MTPQTDQKGIPLQTAPLCMPMVAGDGGTLDPAEHFDSEH